MNASEYIIQKLADHGVKHVFMIVGGSAMYLNDAVITNKKITYICNHHEQASTMAAECYSRITNDLSVVLVTSGAASTNTVTGLLGAWWDSIPVMILSGNARTDMLTYSHPQLRELGVQDTRIVDIVKPITKYAVTITDPKTVAYHLEKAMYLALSPRRGPVWLDVPLDIQSTIIDEKTLVHFKVPQKKKVNLKKEVKETLARIAKSKHPVIIVGSGIRQSNSFELFHKVLNKLKIPVLTSLTAQDVMYEKHPYYGGRFGPYGNVRGNDLVKACDFMLILSERLYLWQIGYEYKDFGKNAFKVMVDIDEEELKKKTLSIEYPVLADVHDFLLEMDKQL